MNGTNEVSAHFLIDPISPIGVHPTCSNLQIYYAYQTELITLTPSLRFRKQKGHKIKRKASSFLTPITFPCISTTLVTKKTRATNKEANWILCRIN